MRTPEPDGLPQNEELVAHIPGNQGWISTCLLNCLEMSHLWDRKRHQDRAGHIGTNETAMTNFFLEQQNIDLLHQHLHDISRFLKAHPGEVDLDLAFVCTRGKHRSVCCAWLVHQVGNRNSHGLPDLNDRSWLARPII